MVKMKAILQILCIILVGSGIVIEIVEHAHIGLILITTGSLFFAIATKIEAAGNNRKDN